MAEKTCEEMNHSKNFTATGSSEYADGSTGCSVQCLSTTVEITAVARPHAGSDEPPSKKAKSDVVINGTSTISSSTENKDISEADLKVEENDKSSAILNITASEAVKDFSARVIAKKDMSTPIENKRQNFGKKKKIALLIAYCGAGYHGMQKNPDVNTIEDELLEALCKAGAIKEEIKHDLGKLSFQRCARTDKGVSAAGQVVSLKMVPNESLIPDINQHLPPSIRVFGLKRVTKGFDSKQQCSARTYQYLLQTFSFAPTEMLTVPSYRIKASVIEKINEILQIFCGTHNFHNFTSGKSPNDPSSKRYIISFKAGEPFVKKGHEFITLSVTGQSFMLHQIRKMIGLCIAVCRGYCDVGVIDKSWGAHKVDIPKAPGLGLILDKVHYDGYNTRYGSDGVHEPLCWNEEEKELENFKNSFIWDTIIESEITQKSMLRWLATLNNHTYTENKNLDSKQTTATS